MKKRTLGKVGIPIQPQDIANKEYVDKRKPSQKSTGVLNILSQVVSNPPQPSDWYLAVVYDSNNIPTGRSRPSNNFQNSFSRPVRLTSISLQFSLGIRNWPAGSQLVCELFSNDSSIFRHDITDRNNPRFIDPIDRNLALNDTLYLGIGIGALLTSFRVKGQIEFEVI